MINIIIIYFSILIVLQSKPTEKLELEDAIHIGLNNNFEIKLVQIEADINKVNNTFGNSGMLPNINLNANTTFASNNINQQYSNGNIINTNGAVSSLYGANVSLDWTLFDGFKMFTTKEKLKEIESSGNDKFKIQLQNTILQIIIAYYDIVKQKQQFKSITEVIDLNKERLKISEIRFNSGLSSKNELLQAQVDLNIQTQNSITQINLINESKRNLSQIIKNTQDEDFDVDVEINFLNLDSTYSENKLVENNLNLIALKREIEISKLVQNEIEALNYPNIIFNSTFAYNETNNSAGFSLLNKANGIQAGLKLSFPIFQGFNISRQIQITELNSKSVEFKYNYQKSMLSKQFNDAKSIYSTQLQLFTIEEETNKYAKENVNLALERLRLAQTNSLEVREAQLTYENSLTRLNNIKYNLKLAETKIRFLFGTL
ncbi:MAG: TolC family protein [Candidatus Kapabacteria bacterium]|nr:TolC family protein [Candidatus Kapabacteria bacterium]